MLHPVPNSAEKPRMGYVLGLQTRLMDALFSLPEGATVDLDWLTSVWPELEDDWIRDFLENDKKRRQNWLNTIAAADGEKKADILGIMLEQHAFRQLYDSPPTLRVREVNWEANDVLKAVRNLLKDFYAPYLYAGKGYRLPEDAGVTEFHRVDFVAGFVAVRVCPYCDNYLQTTELDHFLPKDAFPFLSCHPENLVPSCHDSNKADGHKGIVPPLEMVAPDQALLWFNPYLRVARDVLRVRIDEQPDNTLTLVLTADNDTDRQRVAKMNKMFLLSEFWGKDLDGTIRDHIQNVVDELVEEGVLATEEKVADRLKRWRSRAKREIGKHGLAISREAILEFTATSPALVKETLAQYGEDSRT